MAARAGLAGHIAWLRGLVAAGATDYAVGGVDYWSDDQLQQALDQSRRDVFRLPVAPIPVYEGAVLVYKRYKLAHSWVEGVASGAGAWNVVNSAGAVVSGDDYTLDAQAGEVTFDADTAGVIYLFDYRAYDLNGAAALVWEMKAAHFAGDYDVKTDNHDLKRSQRVKQAQDMARLYRSRAVSAAATGSRVVRMRRDDTV